MEKIDVGAATQTAEGGTMMITPTSDWGNVLISFCFLFGFWFSISNKRNNNRWRRHYFAHLLGSEWGDLWWGRVQSHCSRGLLCNHWTKRHVFLAWRCNGNLFCFVFSFLVYNDRLCRLLLDGLPITFLMARRASLRRVNRQTAIRK